MAANCGKLGCLDALHNTVSETESGTTIPETQQSGSYARAGLCLSYLGDDLHPSRAKGRLSLELLRQLVHCNMRFEMARWLVLFSEEWMGGACDFQVFGVSGGDLGL